jgi:glycosyltransferase involved in cell wall biosynthesis
MRIGIYNRWLQTMGGGERDMGAFAQVLQAEHDVELLTHQPIDLAVFASRLNLTIPRVKLRLVPYDPEYVSVIAASRDYDLFINSSHLDMFIPEARRNVLRVFFPTRSAYDTPADATRRGLGLHTLVRPSQLKLLAGLYGTELDADRPFAWTGPRAQFLVERRSRRPPTHLQLILHGWRPEGAPNANVQLIVNDTPLATRELPPVGVWADWRVPLPPELARERALYVRLETTSFNPYQMGLHDDARDLGVALAAMRLIGGAWSARLAERLGSGVPDPAAFAALHEHRLHFVARSYDQILAISRFTQYWIERRWSVPSEIIFPPVDTSCFWSGAKRPIILSVGRFFEGSHNKKHLPMIQAFRALCDAGLQGWEYHLAGGCDEAMPEHRAYLEQIRAAAAGYPIVLHVNAPFAELQQLYSESRLFWHATGYGEDENRDPDSFEHFGITTVEAMAAGCVPVVIAKAGQIETVVSDESGLLWHTLDELQAQTRRLIGDPALAARLSAGALQRSRQFEIGAFARRVHEALALDA